MRRCLILLLGFTAACKDAGPDLTGAAPGYAAISINGHALPYDLTDSSGTHQITRAAICLFPDSAFSFGQLGVITRGTFSVGIDGHSASFSRYFDKGSVFPDSVSATAATSRAVYRFAKNTEATLECPQDR